jgi:hypothetical protein
VIGIGRRACQCRYRSGYQCVVLEQMDDVGCDAKCLWHAEQAGKEVHVSLAVELLLRADWGLDSGIWD